VAGVTEPVLASVIVTPSRSAKFYSSRVEFLGGRATRFAEQSERLAPGGETMVDKVKKDAAEALAGLCSTA
jgi:hypothetical protein